MTEIVPTERMASALRILDMDYALDGNPASRYRSSIVRWLPGQLPGRDMRNVGWGLLVVAVDATPKPERSGSSAAVNSGMRSIMLNAGQVGKALIGSSGPAAEPSPDVGWDLADLRPAMADLAREVATTLPPSLDFAELGEGAADTLREIFPGADVAGAGWGALGTAMILAKEVQEVYSKIARGHMRRRSREEKEKWGNGAMIAAIVLGRIGDFLISQA